MSQIGCNTRSTAKASGSSNPLSSTQPSQPPLPVISSRSSFSNVSVPAADDAPLPLGTVPPISEEITDPPRGSIEANIAEPGGITPDAPVVPEVADDLADSKLASAVELLTSKLSSITERKPKSTVKPRAPDVFDGTDPAKLETLRRAILPLHCASRALRTSVTTTSALSRNHRAITLPFSLPMARCD